MKTFLSFLRRSWITGAYPAVPGGSAAAMFMSPQPTPVDRLIKSAEAYLAKRRDEAKRHYTLARIHYLAFHLKRDQVPTFRYDEKADAAPHVAPQWMVGPGRCG